MHCVCSLTSFLQRSVTWAILEESPAGDGLIRWAALTLAALCSGPQIGCMTKPTIDIAAMTAHERLELAEELWNSLAADPDALPLSNEQAAELDRRVAAYRSDRDPGRPWAEVLAEIEAAHHRRSA